MTENHVHGSSGVSANDHRDTHTLKCDGPEILLWTGTKSVHNPGSSEHTATKRQKVVVERDEKLHFKKFKEFMKKLVRGGVNVIVI